MRPHRPNAFSLVELLSVITIASIMLVVAAPAVSTLSRGDRLSAGLPVLTGLISQGRQYAIANNTYVWVLVGDKDGQTKVVVAASKSGLDPLGWSTGAVDLNSRPDLEQVGRIETLEGIKVADMPTATIANLPSETAASFATVNFKAGSGDSAVTFTRAIQFAPAGEAKASAATVRYLDLALLPVNAASSPNQAVLRVAGLTGKPMVYRN
jgi:prepilin-type N-terminal cleavage/methylation domain-containing protein